MRLTRHVDYAVRVMIELASHPPGAAVPRARIGERQDVPAAYLAKIVQSLARAGLVHTQRGARGGISLGGPADTMTLRRVIEAVEGPIHLNRCVAAPGACPRDRFCPAHPIWARIQTLVTRELESVCVEELALASRNPGPAKRQETSAC